MPSKSANDKQPGETLSGFAIQNTKLWDHRIEQPGQYVHVQLVACPEIGRP